MGKKSVVGILVVLLMSLGSWAAYSISGNKSDIARMDERTKGMREVLHEIREDQRVMKSDIKELLKQ